MKIVHQGAVRRRELFSSRANHSSIMNRGIVTNLQGICFRVALTNTHKPSNAIALTAWGILYQARIIVAYLNDYELLSIP